MSEKDMPQWWHNKSVGDVRIMTICEGYVMARKPKYKPFVMAMADFKNMFKEGKTP